MFSVTLKLMKKSGKMLVPAGIAILIGTAFIAVTFLFGNSMDNQLRSWVTSEFMQADYVVTSKESDKNSSLSFSSGDADITVTQNGDKTADEGTSGGDASNESETKDEFSERGKLSTVKDYKIDQIGKVDGVSATQVMIDASGTIKTSDRSASAFFGLGCFDKRLQAVDVVQGKSPLSGEEVAIPQALAEKLHLKIGDSLSLTSNLSATDAVVASDVKLVGLTEDTHQTYSMFGGMTLVSPQVCAKIYQVKSFDEVMADGILFNVDPNKADEALRRVKAIEGGEMNVKARDQIAEEKMKKMGGDSSPVKVFLMVFGVLAMFVAALVIANTFHVLVAQRRRTLALLRTIGAKKRQLYCSVLLEACMLGLIASSLGILAAIGLMGAVCKLGVGFGDGAMTLTVTWPVVVVPLLFGIVVTVLACLGSARSATVVTPLEALRPIEVSDTRKAGVVRAVLGVSAMLIGAFLCKLGAGCIPEILKRKGEANADAGYDSGLLASMAGCALIFTGLAVTAAFWMPLLMRGIGALVACVGPSAKVANANIQKNPRRIASTGVALMIGVTLVCTIATGAACGKTTMSGALDSHYGIDVMAEGSGLSKREADAVANVDGVSDTLYLPAAMATFKQNGGKDDLSALLVGVNDKNALQKVMRADISAGSIAPGTVLAPVYDGFGKKLNFPDNTIEFNDVGGETAQDGVRLPAMKVAQVDYRKVTTLYSMVAFVDESVFSANNFNTDAHVLFMKLDLNSAKLSDIYENLNKALGDDNGVMVTGPIAERIGYEMAIDAVMKMVVALLAISVLIALIGVVNTLSLSVIERTRESATLRALGMTRGQLKRSLACEALLIALVSGALGVALGTLFGWFGSYMVFSLYGDVTYVFDWKFSAVVMLIAVLAAWVSSVIPARRAVKTPPVEALSEA